jgi:uncharacterized DUF497 family protein
VVYVFDDPLLLSEPDPHPEEDRWRVIGQVRMTTLFVVHTRGRAGWHWAHHQCSPRHGK